MRFRGPGKGQFLPGAWGIIVIPIGRVNFGGGGGLSLLGNCALTGVTNRFEVPAFAGTTGLALDLVCDCTVLTTRADTQVCPYGGDGFDPPKADAGAGTTGLFLAWGQARDYHVTKGGDLG